MNSIKRLMPSFKGKRTWGNVAILLVLSLVLTITVTSCTELDNLKPEEQESIVAEDVDGGDQGFSEENQRLEEEKRLEEERKLEAERKVKEAEEKAQEEEDRQRQEEEANAKVEGELKVHFLDVGQGDSALIVAGNNAMLIDAGDRGYGSGIVSYLKNQGVKKLDYLILTHPHADHIGGAVEVINAFEIDKIIMSKVSHTTQTFENLLVAIDKKGMKITTPNPGDEYELDSARFKILAPNSSSYKSLNDYSVVARINFGNTAFLFTGDAESTSESQMVSSGHDLKSDVLKVGHHGSDTSTTGSFLKSVEPKFAVISVGKGNKYGHPKQGVLERLNSHGVKVYRTDEAGTIIATSDGTNITFDKEASSIAKSSSSSQGSSNSSTGQKSKSSEITESKGGTKTTTEPETDYKEEVYITKTGSKYHRGNCRHLKSSKIPISLEKAKSDGYEPCKTCKP